MNFFLRKLLLRPGIAPVALKALLKLHHQIGNSLGLIASAVENGKHPKHRLMHHQQYFFEHINNNMDILDIGCGKGVLSLALGKHVKSIVGLELDYTKLNVAEKRRARQDSDNVFFLVGNAFHIPFNGAFDAIVLSNVLEHLENREEFLTQLSIIAPMMLLRVPMIDRDWITLYKKELGLPYLLDNTHCIEYTHNELKQELKSGGWKIKDAYNAFGETWAVCERQ